MSAKQTSSLHVVTTIGWHTDQKPSWLVIICWTCSCQRQVCALTSQVGCTLIISKHRGLDLRMFIYRLQLSNHLKGRFCGWQIIFSLYLLVNSLPTILPVLKTWVPSYRFKINRTANYILPPIRACLTRWWEQALNSLYCREDLDLGQLG